jgi:hypothetical protein
LRQSRTAHLSRWQHADYSRRFAGLRVSHHTVRTYLLGIPRAVGLS